MSRLILKGCTTEPLSSYLTSLAVLRLVSEQKDSDAKGCWQDGYFCLDSKLNEEDLVHFFQEEYAPTPIVAPWSGGSGFYEGDNTEGIDAIRKSTNHRFALYRETIELVSSFPEMPSTGLSLEAILSHLEKDAEGKRGKARDKILELVRDTRSMMEPVARLLSPDDLLSMKLENLQELSKLPRKASQMEKEKSAVIKDLLKPARKALTQVKKLKRDAGKEKIILTCRNRLSEHVIEWIDAAAVIGSEGDAEYPPILGSGGNEGRLDYSNTFMTSISGLLLSPDKEEFSRNMLWNALFGKPTEGLIMVKVGQYNPGRSGGFNQGPGIENKVFPANPWSFVLTLEGAIVWASGAARRYNDATKGFLTSPFTVGVSPVGYNSSSNADKPSKKDKRKPAEIWVPLWRQPVCYSELRSFFCEGRADVGKKTATSGIEFAEAASSLGIDRGVSEFVRYSLLKRRGDSFVALPAGRFSVQERSESDLVRELDPLLRRIDRFLRDFKKEPPAQFISARRQLDEALFNLLLHGGPNYVKSLLSALGRMEQLVALRDLSKKPMLNAPLYGLSPRWLIEADDGSIEIRLATSLASIGGTGGVGPIRANLESVDPEKPRAWAKSKGQFAWQGSSLAMKMASTLQRRIMDAQRLNCKFNPLYGDIPLEAEDIEAFIEGDVDEKQVEDLLFGLALVRWDERKGVHDAREKLMDRWAIPATSRIISRSWSLLKLVFLPDLAELPGGDEVKIRPEPSILPLLLAGRIGDSCIVAQRRLYAAGLAPIRSRFPEDNNGARIAAALLLPLRSHQKIAELVLRKKEQNA